VGWSLGGGYGPFSNKVGLGVDNMIEVELITANLKTLVVN